VWNVGDSMNDSGWVAPVYWKNGKIVELSRISDTRPGYADDITIHNGDIYVAGETFTEDNPGQIYYSLISNK
jgi:hypothetical protein